MIGPDAIGYRKRETRHQVSSHTSLKDAPPLRSIQNRAYGKLGRIEKLSTKRGNPLLVKPSGLDQFLFGIWVINQEHPTARRAARITSSWVHSQHRYDYKNGLPILTPEHGLAGAGRSACQRQPAGQDKLERTRQTESPPASVLLILLIDSLLLTLRAASSSLSPLRSDSVKK